MSGLLGIWNNANQKFLHDYEDWYNNEHLFERLSIPNINVARRFQGLKSNYNYFTSYEATTYETFFSEEYLKKLNKPTKKTKYVMEFVFEDMFRTVFKKTILKGSIRGAFCLIISIRDIIEVEKLINFQKNITNINQVYSEVWESKEIKDYKISKEESLRGKDKKFSNCLYLEYTNENDAMFLMDEAKRNFNEAEIGIYQLISTLT